MSLLSSFFPASLDDILFEGRNQAYGAYQLRQSYNRHMRIALSLMIGLCALLLMGGVLWQRLHPLINITKMIPVAPEPVVPPIYVTEPPKPLAPPAAPSQAHVAAPTPHAASSFPTKIVKDEVARPTPPVVPIVAEVAPGLATTGIEAENAIGAGTPGGTGTAATGSATGTGEAAAVVGPYVVVEKMPEFAGGTDALMRYLRTHLRYPGAALAAQAEGRVYVSFVVQADGTIADVAITKGLGYGLDEEAQRVVRQMPTWTPGQQAHHAVPVRFTLPITFRIQ